MKKKDVFQISCDEHQIKNTIEIAKNAFLASEKEQTLTGFEFLYQQCGYIKKRWWLIQGILLWILCRFLHYSESAAVTRRCLGVAAPLFVILVFPELWKNKKNDAMEVECATFYNIRQVYSARLMMFIGVDFLLITGFFLWASFSAKLTFWDMMIQFILPCNVSCCIAFYTLYNSRFYSETFSVLLCSIWTAIWVMVILREELYMTIAAPVWGTLLVLSYLFLAFTIVRGQKNLIEIWEGKLFWT